MSCKEISADWAAQRIKGLSLGSAIKNALIPQRYNGDRTNVIKTLINSFRYPRRGPGMMWEACAEKMKALGGKLEMGCRVTALFLRRNIRQLDGRIQRSTRRSADNRSRTRHFVRADAGADLRIVTERERANEARSSKVSSIAISSR